MSSVRVFAVILVLVLIAACGYLLLAPASVPPPKPSALVPVPAEKTTAHADNMAKDTPAPEPVKKEQVSERPADSNAAKKNENIYIGRFDGPTPHRINTVLTTRKGTAVYQGMIRYEPQSVPLTDVPGLNDVLDTLNRQGRPIPSTIYRIDQETEALVDNLGEPVRSITSYHAYMNPFDSHVIAYDLAMTTGGQAQRFAGHLTKEGIGVDIYRGNELVDHNDIPFPLPDTFILPLQMEFVHGWYENPEHHEMKTKAEPVKFSVFIPEIMGFVRLVVKPLGDQVIPVQSSNQTCARYEVLAISTQSSEGLQARQEMWFDKRSGVLMRREDFDPTMKPGDAPVVERTRIEDLAQLRQLDTPPPQVPDKPYPGPLDRELHYSIRAKDKDIGRLRVRFMPGGGNRPGAQYSAEASVAIEAENATRHELATTLFDAKWRPLHYEAEGTETVDAKAAYKIEADINHGKINISLERKVEDLKPAPADSPIPASVPSVPPQAEGPRLNSDSDNSEWHDPLVRVPVSDADAKNQESATSVPKVTHQILSHPVFDGTFLYDFNRVEQLAVLAQRLPLPPAPTEHDPSQVTYQKVAIFSVRQNRGGVLLFEIRPEVKPVLTERQKRRLDPDERNEPQLYVATVAGALLPCRILLTPDGRILELTTKHGNGDVTYTLDDPIMRHRAERARKKKLQEGPQLLRPPWY